MSLYSTLFYSEDFNNLLLDEVIVRRMLNVESALAQSQGELGIIPERAARAIANCCKVHFVDMNRLKEEVVLGGNMTIPLVRQLVRIVKNNDFESSKYVHYGATSQDIIDTVLSLTIQEVNVKVDALIVELQHHLAGLAKRYQNTVMVGRTLMQQSKPITFGLKSAYWLQAILSNRVNLTEVSKRSTFIQLGGAVASRGKLINEEVMKSVAKKLGLRESLPWQSDRTNPVQWSSSLAILNGSLGKIAKDVTLLMQTEVAEVFEGAAKDKGGSSTMPHKRNPVTCSIILANAHRVPHLMSSLISGMVQDHERSAGLWHAEWEVISGIIRLVGGSLIKTIDLIKNLEVDEEKMHQNLEVTQGLIYAENVFLALAPKIGKNNAHEWVQHACKQAREQNQHLKSIIVDSEHDFEHVEEMFDPEKSLGDAIGITNKILEDYEHQL